MEYNQIKVFDELCKNATEFILDDQTTSEEMTKCKHILTFILYLEISAEFAFKDEKKIGRVKLGKKRMEQV